MLLVFIVMILKKNFLVYSITCCITNVTVAYFKYAIVESQSLPYAPSGRYWGVIHIGASNTYT